MINTIENTALESLMISPEQQAPKKNELGQDEFLNLMLTQLKYQDPFKPMENGEFIAQLAQFSNVEGINKMSSSIEELGASFNANQALQASSLLGRDVLVANNFSSLNTGESIEGAYELPASTGNANINIYDLAGNLVHQIQQGEKPSGQHDFSWDGTLSDGSRAADGLYEVRVDYSTGEGTSSAEVFIQSTIKSVNFAAGGGEVVLNTNDGQSLGILDIRQIQ